MSGRKVLDLFSGCGGLSYGLEMAGFEITAAVDSWTDALITFKKNHKESTTLEHDLSVKLPSNFLKAIGKIDLVVGGPPCQGFSISGPRNPGDPRNSLYKGFVSTVKHLKPKAFILENVPNLVTMAGGAIKRQIIKDFENLGYKVGYSILTASDYGVPQNRKRVIFVGLRDKIFEFPERILKESDRLTCSDAISDLPEESMLEGEVLSVKAQSPYQKWSRTDENCIYNHVISNHEEKTVKTIAMVPDGGNYKDLPKPFQNTRKVNIAWTRYNSSKPSLTIDTGHRHHFHYKYNRIPTVRESARLQSFPDSFIFYGTKTSQYKQVGNAVPPLLGKALGKQISSFI